MQTRKWKLPGVQDLTKDQEAALAYSAKGQHLVIGGPGTGKTVVMVMRAIQLRRQGTKHVFLVYNHMLHQASQQMAGEPFTSSTYMSWFCKKFREITGEYVPNLKPYEYDWTACVSIASEISGKHISLNEKELLIIDEGQDMPPGFYETLIYLGYENFFVAADQNQQIWGDRNSSRQDLEDVLAIDTTDVIELKHNFRNNYGIARLARAFYTGDPASPPPKLPDQQRRIYVPILYTFQNQPGVYIGIAKKIIKFFLRDRQKLIGVITPNHRVRKKYLDALKESAVLLSENSVKIYTYDSENKHVRFDEGCIVVLNAQSCKGLEFDAVVLADIHEHFIHRDDRDATKKLFYVMVSRACDAVFLLMKDDSSNQIHDILPKDVSVLQRKKIAASHA
ncbi:MAG: AAA family ATPase [Rhodothermaceae bacterium]|nr:AAA family ATPase [Rhodothermaceae bacterium]MXZ57053.1 AAA family ATPase [Rhodothermaceae bacterium]MYD68656.1 AAA family ATPase [Rhodothermaceae bacterium]MYH12290.1 AAA family ATPase [Rhodothermaceae bacterium]MYJ06640.1 AAA family ATPase [Rhodothermaceae bacterium]